MEEGGDQFDRSLSPVAGPSGIGRPEELTGPANTGGGVHKGESSKGASGIDMYNIIFNCVSVQESVGPHKERREVHTSPRLPENLSSTVSVVCTLTPSC